MRPDASAIAVAHEVRGVGWPQFRRWIDERRADEQRRRRLEAKVSEWIERGSGTASLLDAVELAEAVQWIASDSARALGHSVDLEELIAASRARDRRIRRIFVGAGAGIILLLAVIAATAISVARAQEQELQRDVLRTNAYAAHALAGGVAFRLREEVDATVAIAADPTVVWCPVSRVAGSPALRRWAIPGSS
jgi:hypothetical protein